MENSKAVNTSWAVLTRALFDDTVSATEFGQMMEQHNELIAAEGESEIEIVVVDLTSRDRKLLILLCFLALFGILFLIGLVFLPIIYLANVN